MGIRRPLVALVVAATAGLAAGVLTPSAAMAFPRICSGTSCHGSATDSIPGADVCVQGTGTFWEDSYLPADALDPHLTSFEVTPDPPCTGATVSKPTVEAFPASRNDPDGRPSTPKPGEATFRVTWTVTVPPLSTVVGPMTVKWSIAWDEPGGSGTTKPPLTRQHADAYVLGIYGALRDETEARSDLRTNTYHSLGEASYALTFSGQTVYDVSHQLEASSWQGPNPIPDLNAIFSADRAAERTLRNAMGGDGYGKPLPKDLRDRLLGDLAAAIRLKTRAIANLKQIASRTKP